MSADEQPTGASETETSDLEVSEPEASDIETSDTEATDTEAHPPEADVAAPAPPDGDVKSTPAHRVTGWLRRRWVAVLAAAVLVSAVAAGSVYWWLYRPDRLTDIRSQEQVLDVARGATEALLSYSPDNVDKNVADAKSRLTGDFLQRYSEFADTVVVPAAKERGVKTEANVARAAVSRMSPDSAQVLAFVNQVTTSRERPTPALATSSVMVTLVRHGGQWLISEFTPI